MSSAKTLTGKLWFETSECRGIGDCPPSAGTCSSQCLQRQAMKQHDWTLLPPCKPVLAQSRSPSFALADLMTPLPVC